MADSTGSDFNVEVVKVANVGKHPNADRLSIATINGVQTIFKTEDFKPGDLAVFIPVDALVPLSNEDFAFLASKSHPERKFARIRAMKLRGIYSEGMLVPLRLPRPEGANVQAELGIEKYETAADQAENGTPPQPNSKRTLAKKFNDLVPIYKVDSFDRMSGVLQQWAQPYVLTEKIHGANARYANIDGRFYVGSHRTLRSVSAHRLIEWFKRTWRAVTGKPASGYYSETIGDIWLKVAQQAGLETICRENPGKVIYGEIYGKGVQTRGGVEFTYDSPDGLGFRVFDVYDVASKTFLCFNEMERFCHRVGLSPVPYVKCGFYNGKPDEVDGREGPSLIGNHIREGVVLRTDVGMSDHRHVLKLVSKAYKMLGGADE